LLVERVKVVEKYLGKAIKETKDIEKLTGIPVSTIEKGVKDTIIGITQKRNKKRKF
jgi:hypothetical protein